MQGSVKDVGAVSFARASGLSGRLSFGRFSGQEGLGVGVVPLLDDGDAVKGRMSWRLPPR